MSSLWMMSMEVFSRMYISSSDKDSKLSDQLILRELPFRALRMIYRLRKIKQINLLK